MTKTYESSDVFHECSDRNPCEDVQLPLKFKSTLSLKPVIDYWLTESEDKLSPRTLIADRIRVALKDAPELLEPIEDRSILDKHSDLVSLLMTASIAPNEYEHDAVAAASPFGTEFYMTPNYKKLFPSAGLWECNSMVEMDKELYNWGKALHVYALVLRVLYGMDVEFDYPLVTKLEHPETGLARYYKFEFNSSFVDLRVNGTLPELTEKDKSRLRKNLTDLNLLTTLIPPELFEFYGFVLFRAVDVTDEQVISLLKRELIDQQSFTLRDRFETMEELIQIFLRRPEIHIGLTVFTNNRQPMTAESVRRIGHSFIIDEHEKFTCNDLCGSIYESAMRSGAYDLVYDIQEQQNPTGPERQLLKGGWRNIGILPLHSEDRLIGIMELASKTPGAINGMNSIKLREIEPLFATALKRSLDELDNQVQAIIKEKCTAIHPSVEWRFRDAALRSMRDQKSESAVEMEPISFDAVYPLYGLSDIRNSSVQRNTAIRADLHRQMDLGSKIVEAARRAKEMPFLGKLQFELQSLKDSIESGIGSGDELEIYGFLSNDLEPLFEKIEEFGDEVAQCIKDYRSALDSELGMIYDKRRDFDSSVTMLTDAISLYMDKEQEHAQNIYPHYFEKYKTDGVDHSMYIGASMAPQQKFDLMYLKNLRLWQIIVTCGIAHRLEALKSEMPVPLEIANLILVQDNPLAIRFRYDEKHFDVDGAYNVRYEIMKKRIDKARISGTKERLTQPGKIAIVYSQAKEATEYRQYIEYLQSTGCVMGELEDVEIEPLQGIQGLRALRVDVNMSDDSQVHELIEPDVSKIVAELASYDTL